MTKPDENGWLPIETAPKDGAELSPRFGPIILLATPDDSWAIGYRDEEGHGPAREPGWICIQSHRPLYTQGWTHWQPLPKPPVTP